MSEQLHAYVVSGRLVAFGTKEEITDIAVKDFNRYIELLSMQMALGKPIPKTKAQ